jgi:hypothetical protein
MVEIRASAANFSNKDLLGFHDRSFNRYIRVCRALFTASDTRLDESYESGDELVYDREFLGAHFNGINDDHISEQHQGDDRLWLEIRLSCLRCWKQEFIDKEPRILSAFSSLVDQTVIKTFRQNCSQLSRRSPAI